MKFFNEQYLMASLAMFLLILSAEATAQLRLPALISSGMVLQRDTRLTIWGWTVPEAEVSISFAGSLHTSRAADDGKWMVYLDPLPAGGPYTMTIISGDTLTIDDILTGDVWVCSGQSNMELPMRRVSWVYPEDICQARNPSIRQFYVPRMYAFHGPQEDLTGGRWVAADPETVLDFSAAAYFFAKHLYDVYGIPVGIINTAYGGSPAEAWISEDVLKSFPIHHAELIRMKDDELVRRIREEDQQRIASWHRELRRRDTGYKQTGQPWFMSGFDDSDWNTMSLPGYWGPEHEVRNSGVVWFRKHFELPETTVLSGEALLILGSIVDSDSVYVNGHFVGSTGYQYPPRRYNFAAKLLRHGHNVITARVISESGRGGFVPDKDYTLFVGGQNTDLTGAWRYRQGAEMSPLEARTFFNTKPGGLYNAMIHPLIHYAVRGFAWYQGESNVDRYQDYHALMLALINDWRDRWGQQEAPFVYVQLPNFGEPSSQPGASNWAGLREAQQNLLKIPGTAMAVAIDIGAWNDIHPLNKKDVGYRLALAARHLAYGDNSLVSSGPLLRASEVHEGKMVLWFDMTGSGLVAHGETLKQFAIAGEDRQFVWARAEISGDKVIVWHEDVPHPVAVRYAWSDNPYGANLYNREGLPASPFRTDSW